jgi:hypothetical protein
MNKITACSVLLGCLFLININGSCQQVKAKVKSGNPVFAGWYADPEGIIFNKHYWIYPTFSAPYKDQVFFDAFSSPDLVNWTKHHRILDTVSMQDPGVATGAGHHSVLHVPKSDKWYIVYHRRPVGDTDANHRVTCIDEMRFDAKGNILPVKITKEGIAMQVIE